MVKVNSMAITLDHLVIFERKHSIFVCARENSNGRICLFLVTNGDNEERVYARNNQTDSWEDVDAQDARVIRTKVEQSKEHIPTYHTEYYYS